MHMIVTDTKQALGGDVTIVLTCDDALRAHRFLETAWRKIFLFERSFSRFLPASELSLFNRQAGIKQPISPEFKALLTAVQAMAQLSDGLYNPFILPALQRAGYSSSAMPGYEHDKVDDYSSRSVVSASRLEVGDTWARIPHGTALDMGGIGKGYLADLLADLLDEESLQGYWVSLGGDMVLSGVDAHGAPWQTTIQSAYENDVTAPVIVQHSVKRQAVATSGTLRRRNQPAGADWHHIIDPFTGRPAKTDIRLVTVIDSSCLRADVLASCAIIYGAEDAVSYLKARKVSGAYMQLTDGKVKHFGSALKVKKGEHAHIF